MVVWKLIRVKGKLKTFLICFCAGAFTQLCCGASFKKCYSYTVTVCMPKFSYVFHIYVVRLACLFNYGIFYKLPGTRKYSSQVLDDDDCRIFRNCNVGFLFILKLLTEVFYADNCLTSRWIDGRSTQDDSQTLSSSPVNYGLIAVKTMGIVGFFLDWLLRQRTYFTIYLTKAEKLCRRCGIK